VTESTHQDALAAIHDDPRGETWTPEVSEHVVRCEPCQKTLKALQSLMTSMRRRTKTVQAPPELVAHVCRSVQAEQTKAQRRRQKVVEFLIPTALAAGLVIGVLLPRSSGPATPGGLVPDMTVLLDDTLHDRLLLEDANLAVEYASNDAGTLSSWLTRGLGFDVSLPSAPADWELRGGRIWHTAGAMSALAEYENDGEIVTVFARPRSGMEIEGVPDDAPEGATMSWRLETGDHRGVAWVDDDLAWAAIGSGTMEELAAWVESYLAR